MLLPNWQKMASSSKGDDAYVPPWRQPAPKKEKYDHLKMKAVKEKGKDATMYAPPAQKRGLPQLETGKPNMFEFDEDLTMAFQRNFQVLLSCQGPNFFRTREFS